MMPYTEDETTSAARSHSLGFHGDRIVSGRLPRFAVFSPLSSAPAALTSKRRGVVENADLSVEALIYLIVERS